MLARRRVRDTQGGEGAQERERVVIGRRRRLIETWRDCQRRMSWQDALAEMLPVRAFGRREERVAHSFNAAPIALQKILVLLDPKRDGCCHLRSSCRCAFTVLTDLRALTENRPWNIWRVGGNRRRHRTIRPPTSLELPISNVVIRLPICHDAAHRDRAMVSRWVNDVVRWKSAT